MRRVKILNKIFFLNKHCRAKLHSICPGQWAGFGFEIYCNCSCHTKKDDAADGFGRPDFAASSHISSEVTKENDLF